MLIPEGDFLLIACENRRPALYFNDPRSTSSTLSQTGIIVRYKHKAQQLNFNATKELDAQFSDLTENLSHKQQNIQLKFPEKSVYLGKVNELLNHIKRGNVYEVNFCVEFVAEGIEINPLEVFRKLKEKSGAPFCYLAKTGEDYILCASPERFIKKDGRRLISQPMKGTAARGKTEEEDLRNAEELLNNIKERSENIMAVDVARHDLSQLAEKGSVEVPELCKVLPYKTVHQMISTVSCQLKRDFSLQEILDCTFPMASMTGAPKTRAMQLIDEYEGFNRNYYSGCIGLADKNGDFDLHVIIRSIYWNKKSGRLSFSVGSALTALADPEQEWEECMLKAKAMIEVLNAEQKVC